MTFDQIQARYDRNGHALAVKLATGPLTPDTDLAWQTHNGVWAALATFTLGGGAQWLAEAADRIERAERLTAAL
jgi:hypothetical protein